MRDYTRAELHLTYETIMTADSAERWSQALQHAQSAFAASRSDDPYHGYAMVYIANVLVHTGKLALARTYLSTYMRRWNTAIPALYPYVLALLGQLAYREANYSNAMLLFSRARCAFEQRGNEYEVERLTTDLIWTLVRLGLVARALAELPSRVLPENEARFHGVKCLLLSLQGKRLISLREGFKATRGSRPHYDGLDAAETLLVMSRQVRNANAIREYMLLANKYASRQAQDVRAVLALSYRQGGGELLHAETGTRGSANPHDGCSFTSGVA